MNLKYDEIKYLHIGEQIFEIDGMKKIIHKEFSFKQEYFDVIYISKAKISNDLSGFVLLKKGGCMILEECDKTDDFLLCSHQYYDFIEHKNNLYYIKKSGCKKE
jgi:hypothetical protein